ncbi:unnamed protein product, partial [Rotaria sp. Silwood1]
MINPDNLKWGQIQDKLPSKEFVLVNNAKAAHKVG